MSPEEAAGGVAVGRRLADVAEGLTELHAGQLAGVADGYTVTGCPINLPFCDSATIREAVKRTCIAETTRFDVARRQASNPDVPSAVRVGVRAARLTKHPY